MIVYRDTKHALRLTPPPWLEGAANLHSRDDAKDGRLWGIGDPFLLEPASAGWAKLGDGWEVRLVGRMNAAWLIHDQQWCDVLPAKSLTGIIWMAPRILQIDGSRGFRVTYGDNFLPSLTSVQKRAYAIAEEARVLLSGASESGGLDASLACQYAAELLSCVNHVTPEVLAKLRLLDDALVLEVLAIGAGYRQEVASADR